MTPENPQRSQEQHFLELSRQQLIIVLVIMLLVGGGCFVSLRINQQSSEPNTPSIKTDLIATAYHENAQKNSDRLLSLDTVSICLDQLSPAQLFEDTQSATAILRQV